jgi:hypothetical protein
MHKVIVERSRRQTLNEKPKPLERFFESRAGKPLAVRPGERETSSISGGRWTDSVGSLDGRRRAAIRQAAAASRRNASEVGRVRVQARRGTVYNVGMLTLPNRFLRLLAFTFLLVAANASASLIDPGFESGVVVPGGVGGWDVSGGSAFSVAQARSGSRSMFAATAPGAVPVAFQFLPATAGSEWQLTGYGLHLGLPAQTSGAVFGLIQITFFSGPNGSGTNLGTLATSPGNAQLSVQINSQTPSSTWTFLDTGVATAPAGTQSVGVYAVFVNFTSVSSLTHGVYFDDLALTAVPEPFAPALLLFGAATLLARGRLRA